MAGVVDSYGFMQLDPFIRCNSHWVRDFFPVDDGETLKEANRTGAYKYQSIIKVLPMYTEHELRAWYTERAAQKRERDCAIAWRKKEREFERRIKWQRLQPRPPREKEYLDPSAIKVFIEEDARSRREELAASRRAKAARARYKPDEGVLGYAPPEPYFGDGRTSWVEANPDTWDHLNFQDTQLIRSLAQPSKDDPPQVKELIEKIKENLRSEMSGVYCPADLVVAWKNFFAAMKAIPKLREKLKEFTYEI